VNRVTMHTELDNGCEWQGVASELARAVLYIINNAIEAVAGVQNASITLKVVAGAPFNEIHVIDNGPGIPTELRNRVFEPFFTTKAQPHVGVGLFLANKMIQNSGGRIELRTPANGQGVDVVVYLPGPEA
jgi:signal transduction histidine kinase